MQIILKLNKSLEENAEGYYNQAKKAKSKIDAVEKTINRYQKELEKAKKEQIIAQEKQDNLKLKIKKKKNWYEKFRWFFSSEGFLVIGGRDATTNEVIIKKHVDNEDLVFHTNMAGSPFFVIKFNQEYSGDKTKTKEIGEKTIKESAISTACYSRAWKSGIATADVFYVKSDQVSKQTESGEYMQKGSFMIRGKKTYVDIPKLEIAIGFDEKNKTIIGGPVNSVKAQTDKYVNIIQGNSKPSDIAKKIKKKIDGDLDDIIRMLPPGECKLKD